MVDKNLSNPFRFICLTDDDNGLITNIESLPIAEIGDSLAGPERGWNKLSVFSSTLYDLEGDVLCLDLDLIIVGKLDDLFDYPGDFLIIKDWVKSDLTGNASVYRFTVGAHKEVLSVFENSFESIKKTFRNEQEYLSDYMKNNHSLNYWPIEWCQSFKKNCVQKGFKQFFYPPLLPQKAKIIIFHGKPNPPEALKGKSGKWYRKVLPTDWVADHWR